MASESSKVLAGKVVVITGASMGIGEAIAKTFVECGAQVVLLSRDSGRLEAARARIGHAEQTLALACDVRHREEIDRVVGLTMHHFQKIDIWVNNAGHGILDGVATVNMADVRETFETNLFGAMEAMQGVIPIMKQQRSGTIINISSTAGRRAAALFNAYSASKFALTAMTEAMRQEVGRHGIRVCIIEPGATTTEVSEGVADPTYRKFIHEHVTKEGAMKPEDVAGAIVFVASLPPRANVSQLLIRPTTDTAPA